MVGSDSPRGRGWGSTAGDEGRILPDGPDSGRILPDGPEAGRILPDGPDAGRVWPHRTNSDAPLEADGAGLLSAVGGSGRRQSRQPDITSPAPGPTGSIIDPDLARKLEPPRPRATLKQQLASFVAVGAVSAVVDFGLLVILMALGLGHTAAKAVSWVAGTITAYLLNRRFTFRATGSKRRFAAVMALYLITFGVQVGLFAVLYPVLLEWTNRPIAQVVGFVIAQGVATVTNFIVQRAVIFRA